MCLSFSPRSGAVLIAFAATSILGLAASRCFAIGPDNYGYTAEAITEDFEDLTEPAFSPTSILDTTGDSAVTIPIGFPFAFYGKIYTSLSVSTNGLITFGGGDTDPVAKDLTKASPVANLPSIAAFWHDWTFEFLGSDNAYYQTLGSPGTRRLIVQWNFAESRTGPGTDTVTFEAKLFEGSNDIEFHYDDATIDDDANVSNGKAATVGIRDTNGQTGKRNLQWSFNQAVIADATAIRFNAPDFRISSIKRLSNGHIMLQCVGEPNVSNQIQAAPDLVNFTNLTSVVADAAGGFQYEDAAPGARRFYRLLLP